MTKASPDDGDKKSTASPVKAKKKGNKPKRALTAYNLFTGYERERILQGTDHDEKKATVEDVKRISDQYKTKKRRAHRKSHGLISFQELSRIIAERWKSLPEDEKKIFEAQAQIEKQERLARIEVLNTAKILLDAAAGQQQG